MNNPRIYGRSPYSIALLHGGPGAPGTMAPVAKELAGKWGVLEPLQTAGSVAGQIRELRVQLLENGDEPFTLVGSSWGGMLGFLFAARYPRLVRKLILVGSGVFAESYAEKILETRLNRLSEADRIAAHSLMVALDDGTVRRKDALLRQLGELFILSDAYDPLTLQTEGLPVQYDVHQLVWGEVQAMRAQGQLLPWGSHIRCPVVAIHGDYDPHPAAGVAEPLRTVLKEFRMIILAQCGHLPWLERSARDNFFQILQDELQN